MNTDDPVNPGDLYGVTKCFGEAMSRYVAEQEGLSVISISRFKRLDLSDTRPLTGYEPVDDAAALNELVPPELLDRSEHDAGSQE